MILRPVVAAMHGTGAANLKRLSSIALTGTLDLIIRMQSNRHIYADTYIYTPHVFLRDGQGIIVQDSNVKYQLTEHEPFSTGVSGLRNMGMSTPVS